MGRARLTNRALERMRVDRLRRLRNRREALESELAQADAALRQCLWAPGVRRAFQGRRYATAEKLARVDANLRTLECGTPIDRDENHWMLGPHTHVLSLPKQWPITKRLLSVCAAHHVVTTADLGRVTREQALAVHGVGERTWLAIQWLTSRSGTQQQPDLPHTQPEDCTPYPLAQDGT